MEMVCMIAHHHIHSLSTKEKKIENKGQENKIKSSL